MRHFRSYLFHYLKKITESRNGVLSIASVVAIIQIEPSLMGIKSEFHLHLQLAKYSSIYAHIRM